MSKYRDDFGDRMKGYENVTRNYLTRRTPVIIRLDGVAFHTFTRGFDKPFDELLLVTMGQTAQYLCQEVQNCVFAYTQSDEISLVLIDYQNLNTDVWFGNNIQKITSVIASKASVYFNDALYTNALNEFSVSIDENRKAFIKNNIFNRYAFFDARCFNIPKEEVLNYFIWRQKDCQRNSVSAIAQFYFSNKELYKKSTKDRIEMINQYAEENGLYKYEDFDEAFLNGMTVFSKGGWALDFIKERDKLNEMIGVKKDEDND